MARPSKAARRYARALFDLAGETGAQEAVRVDLAALQDCIRQAPRLSGFLGDYLVPRKDRERILRELFAERVQPLTLRGLLFMERKRRLALLDDVCTSYREYDEERRGVLRGRLTSALPLAPEIVDGIDRRISDRVQAQVTLSADTDSRLLGGFRLRVGDMVYDLSVAARLQMLRAVLAGK